MVIFTFHIYKLSNYATTQNAMSLQDNLCMYMYKYRIMLYIEVYLYYSIFNLQYATRRKGR